MEIRFSHVTLTPIEDTSFVIPKESLTAITGVGKEEALRFMAEAFPTKGNIYYNGEKKLKRNLKKYKKEIKYVGVDFEKEFSFENVYEYYIYYLRYHHIKVKDPSESIYNVLKIVGLEEKVLNDNLSNLSSSVLKRFQLSLALLEDSQILLLEEPFLSFHEKEIKEIFSILETLKEKFHKTIVIATEDHNLIYQYFNYLVWLKDKMVLSGSPEELYYQVEGKDKPEIVHFIQMVEEKKGIKLDHRKDIRDLIKDIYRSV